MLDPYYRTLEGFAVLVEKDWLSFGHKFHDRCGNADMLANNQENAPIFLQWLEVVSVLLRQFPLAFEFCSSLLVFLAEHVYSCGFGTFLGNSEQERQDLYDAEQRTESVWSYTFCNPQLFVNSKFEATSKPIWPCTDMGELLVWHDYFCRDCPTLLRRGFCKESANEGSWRTLTDSVSRALASISPTKRRRHVDDNGLPPEMTSADCFEEDVERPSNTLGREA